MTTCENGWVDLAEPVEVGTRIQLITERKEGTYEVLEVASGKFRVALPHNGRVFVYGREVSDFHTVDYEAIAMLNVSATQELVRRLLQSEKTLKHAQTEMNDLNERVARLEQLLQTFHAEK